MTHKRLMRDLAELGEDADDGVILLCCEDMGNVEVLLSGPQDSPFQTGLFNVQITIAIDDYPYEAPLVNFKTPIFHPNISRLDGEVCVDVLKENWAPSITLRAVCEVLQGLLRQPNHLSPLNVPAARMLRNNPDMFNKTVEVWTFTLARGNVNPDPSYIEKFDVVAAIAPCKERALEELSDTHWNLKEACKPFL